MKKWIVSGRVWCIRVKKWWHHGPVTSSFYTQSSGSCHHPLSARFAWEISNTIGDQQNRVKLVSMHLLEYESECFQFVLKTGWEHAHFHDWSPLWFINNCEKLQKCHKRWETIGSTQLLILGCLSVSPTFPEATRLSFAYKANCWACNVENSRAGKFSAANWGIHSVVGAPRTFAANKDACLLKMFHTIGYSGCLPPVGGSWLNLEEQYILSLISAGKHEMDLWLRKTCWDNYTASPYWIFTHILTTDNGMYTLHHIWPMYWCVGSFLSLLDWFFYILIPESFSVEHALIFPG